MRLIVRSRAGAAASGLGRYHRSAIGSGIFGSLARKLFSAGFKKVINVASKANLSQKIADTVVNGAKSAGEKLGKKAGKKLGAVVRKKVVNKFTPKKRSREGSAKPYSNGFAIPQRIQGGESSAKRKRYDSLINTGSGIILQ